MIENHFQYLGMSVQRISMPAKNSSICRGRGQGRAQGWVPMPVVALHQFRAKFKPHYLLLQAPPSDQHAQPAEQWKPATHSHVGWERRVGNVHVGANGGNCVGQHCTGTSGESPLPVKLLKETAERKGHRQDRPCSKQHHTRHAHPGVVPPVRPSPATPPPLTDAAEQGDRIHRPEHRKAALEVHRPEHNVGCKRERGKVTRGAIINRGQCLPACGLATPVVPPRQAAAPCAPKMMLLMSARPSSSAILATR